MSSVLRTTAAARALTRTALRGTRAFHSPFAVLQDSAAATSAARANRTHPGASDYELEYAARTVYVVSEPDPADRPYAVPAGAYPVGVPYEAGSEAPASSPSSQA